MKRMLPSAAAILVGLIFPAFAHDPGESIAKSPPAKPYQQVSKLVPLPDFIPGLGQLFVDPATLPAGPFLAYDHDGRVVGTVYMIPISDLNPDKNFNDLKAPGGNVEHVDVYYNAGHPGVEAPHAHVVLWHIPAGDEAPELPDAFRMAFVLRDVEVSARMKLPRFSPSRRKRSRPGSTGRAS